MKEKKWTLKSNDEEKVQALQKAIHIHPVLCRLLVQRGIYTYEEARMFFRAELKDLHDPFLMKDMDKAIMRIDQALAQKERILIYGDYDVDGTTSVALVYTFLHDFYSELEFYVPHRNKEGYGISILGIDYAKEKGCSLIIALDCGIKAADKARYASERGIDMIICDHHLPGDELPEVCALLDPHQPACNYPFKELSGCGIGFKLVQAYAQRHNIPEEKIWPLLDLVVVSIASDIVSMRGENRILAKYGLKMLNENPRPGLCALVKVANLEFPLNISNIVFGLGPRINAAGRMQDATWAVRLLITGKKEEAVDHAGTLHRHNNNRREVDKATTEEALEMLENDPASADRCTTVLYNESWHKGVIGIVASRLMDHYYRPTILLTRSNGVLSGSARSVKGFDIYEAISACSDLLEQYGGHMFAAGLTLKPENLGSFCARFEEAVRNRITPEQLQPEIEIDAEIALSDISSHNFFTILEEFEPFGPDNMHPVFISRNLYSNDRTRTISKKHLMIGATEKENISYDCIAFGKGEMYDELVRDDTLFNMCYVIEKKTYQGKSYLQLQIRDIKILKPETVA